MTRAGDAKKHCDHCRSRLINIDTLEKYARALAIPMYRFFYEGDAPPESAVLYREENRKAMWGAKGSERQQLQKFAKELSRLNEQRRRLLMAMAQHTAHRRKIT